MNPIERPGISAKGIRPGTAAAAPVARTEPTRAVKEPAVQVDAGITAGDSAPVDSDRVAVIRKAVEEGRYPVVPARIADAMIAAGHLLRTRQ